VKISDLIDLPPDTDAMTALEAVAERDPVVWCMLNRRVKGEALVFDNSRKLSEDSLGKVKKTLIQSDYEDELHSRLLHHRPFLRKPLRDKHKHKVYEKGRQTGGTEVMACEVWHFLATNPGTKAVTTFPRDKQLIDFSNTRVAASFAESPRMAALAGTPNQVFTRRIGDSYWLFRSAWESNLGEGIDADLVALDEKDRMRDKVEFAFKESLKSSKHGLFRETSTPTLPNQGIDIPFRASDQQVWMVKCERCGETQEVTHTESIVQVKDFPLGTKELPAESYDYLCRKRLCRGKLDRVFTGQWVARHPDRNHIRGYHLPQLIAPWISATRVMQDKIDMRFRELWLCYVCGIPAAGETEMLNDADFARACSGHGLMAARLARGWSHVSVGIDWGQLNWVVVMGRNSANQRPYVIGLKVFEDTAKELESAEMVYRYLALFGPDITIADAGYGKDRNSLLLRKLCPNGDEGKFWAQWYNSSIKHGKTFVPEWSDNSRARVTVDRTLTLKNICRSIKEPEFGLPSLEIPEVQLLMRHLKSLAPFREFDDETKEIVETIKSSGDDHFAHALGSAWLGMEKLGKTAKFAFSFE
jgi:hypothetical protein